MTKYALGFIGFVFFRSHYIEVSLSQQLYSFTPCSTPVSSIIALLLQVCCTAHRNHTNIELPHQSLIIITTLTHIPLTHTQGCHWTASWMCSKSPHRGQFKVTSPRSWAEEAMFPVCTKPRACSPRSHFGFPHHRIFVNSVSIASSY